MEEKSQTQNEKLKLYCEELRQGRTMNNRLLFVKGPQFNLKTFEETIAKNRGYYAYPPTGFQYLAAAIEGRGLETQILDLNFEFLREVNLRNNPDPDWFSILEKKLQDYNPSIVGVSNLFTVDIPCFREILEYMKDKEQIIITGGQNATYEGEELLNRGLCHFICERESENKLNFLLDNLYDQSRTKPTPGISFRYQGEIQKTEGDLDIVIPSGNLIEAHKLVPIEDYCKVGSLSPFSRMAGLDTPFAALLFNRGCVANCKFCGVRDYMGKGIRSRCVDDFLDEVEYLNKERGVKFFELIDDDFIGRKEVNLEVLQGLIDRNLDVQWAASNGLIASTLDETLMGMMRDAGCIGFKVGVESGNAEVLRRIKKPGTLGSFRRFSALTQKFPEIFTADNYIIGFPGETMGQMLDSYNFSLEMNLDWSNYSVYQHNVAYFGDEEERKRTKDNVIGDFTPTKDALGGKLQHQRDIFVGRDIFGIDPNTIPSREQVNNIWFTFNLVRNFIMNKNTQSDGDPEKYLSWTNTLEERYHSHPYINFFNSLANRLIGNAPEAESQYGKMLGNLEDTYWNQRFDQFGLTSIVNDFPTTSTNAQKALDSLKKEYKIHNS